MNSVVESTQNDPHDPQNALTARADEELTQAYEKIKTANEQLAHVNERLSKLEHEPERPRKARGKSARRGLIGLLLAAFICAAALASQSSIADTARLIFAGWLPLPAATPSQPQAEPPPGQASPPAVQAADAEPAQPQPAPPAETQTMPEAAAPTVTMLPPELTEQLQKLERDVADLQQGIEQLKSSQQQMKASAEQMKANEEQMARDNAKLAEQLKADQEQMARLVPKTPDRPHDQAFPQNPKLRTSAAPAQSPRPVAASAGRPASTVPPTYPRVRRPIPPESAQQ